MADTRNEGSFDACISLLSFLEDVALRLQKKFCQPNVAGGKTPSA
jgi:hypothetical protein